MYIAGTDGRQVLVIDRNKMKLAHQLSASNMLYPHGIAFSKPLREVYVTGRIFFQLIKRFPSVTEPEDPSLASQNSVIESI
jgi:glutamine cyclotransferase